MDKNYIEITRTDYDIANFKEKAKKADISIISMKWWDYTKYSADDLAIISYKTSKVNKENSPMLFKWFKRIYTYDIPLKLLDFFNVELNKIPNEYWFVQKNEIPLFKKFCADEGIWIRQWNRWVSEKFVWKVDWEMLLRAVELAHQWQENIIINWAAQGMFAPAYATFLSKNLLWMTDNVTINQKIEVAANKFEDLSKLSNEELNNLLLNPGQMMKEIYNINSGNIEEWIIEEVSPIVDNSNTNNVELIPEKVQ